jgi:hypothetical protein
MDFRRKEPTLIDRAVGVPAGQACLAKARERLFDDLRRNRFSCARAVRVFNFSIDEAVWAYVSDSPLRRIIYRDHLVGAERSQKGSHFADVFVQETGATDQKPHRRFALWTTSASPASTSVPRT